MLILRAIFSPILHSSSLPRKVTFIETPRKEERPSQWLEKLKIETGPDDRFWPIDDDELDARTEDQSFQETSELRFFVCAFD